MYSLIGFNNSKQCPGLLFWNEKSAEYFTKALNIQLALEDHLTTLETFNNMTQILAMQEEIDNVGNRFYSDDIDRGELLEGLSLLFMKNKFFPDNTNSITWKQTVLDVALILLQKLSLHYFYILANLNISIFN